VKKAYVQPKAILVEYSYDTNVVATSLKCSGSYWVYIDETGGLNCSEHRLTDFMTKSRSSHPCDFIIDGVKYTD